MRSNSALRFMAASCSFRHSGSDDGNRPPAGRAASNLSVNLCRRVFKVISKIVKEVGDRKKL